LNRDIPLDEVAGRHSDGCLRSPNALKLNAKTPAMPPNFNARILAILKNIYCMPSNLSEK